MARLRPSAWVISWTVAPSGLAAIVLRMSVARATDCTRGGLEGVLPVTTDTAHDGISI